MPNSRRSVSSPKAYIVTGPTSGIGRATTLRLARYGTIVLVGRDLKRLEEVQKLLERKRTRSVSVVCDLSDIVSVRRAAAEIIALNLPITGLLNNAGIRLTHPAKNAQGWDMTFATNYLGPFALTEALAPHLPDGANIVFVASAVEDPERRPARAAGFRGGRFISVEASARGEWQQGGSRNPGFDDYATSKQCVLAAALALAREDRRLRYNAVEPGVIVNTGLGRDAGATARFLVRYVIPLLVPLFMPFMSFLSTSPRAGRMITNVVTDASGKTGIYYDERGRPKQGSVRVRDREFQDRVIAETRKFLSVV